MGTQRFNQIAAGVAMFAALVSCAGAPPSPLISSISVSPASARIQLATSQQLSVSVSGAGGGSVFWKIVEGERGGSIDAHGLYVAPPRPGVFHVLAVSAIDLSMSASASVEVIAPPPLPMPGASEHAQLGPRVELSSLFVRSPRL